MIITRPQSRKLASSCAGTRLAKKRKQALPAARFSLRAPLFQPPGCIRTVRIGLFVPVVGLRSVNATSFLRAVSPRAIRETFVWERASPPPARQRRRRSGIRERGHRLLQSAVCRLDGERSIEGAGVGSIPRQDRTRVGEINESGGSILDRTALRRREYLHC